MASRPTSSDQHTQTWLRQPTTSTNCGSKPRCSTPNAWPRPRCEAGRRRTRHSPFSPRPPLPRSNLADLDLDADPAALRLARAGGFARRDSLGDAGQRRSSIFDTTKEVWEVEHDVSYDEPGCGPEAPSVPPDADAPMGSGRSAESGMGARINSLEGEVREMRKELSATLAFLRKTAVGPPGAARPSNGGADSRIRVDTGKRKLGLPQS